jgi:hypothetical protein
MKPVAQLGGEIGEPHPFLDHRLATPLSRREQGIGTGHAHFAVPALVAPAEPAEHGNVSANYILNAGEDDFTGGNLEGRPFDLDPQQSARLRIAGGGD